MQNSNNSPRALLLQRTATSIIQNRLANNMARLQKSKSKLSDSESRSKLSNSYSRQSNQYNLVLSRNIIKSKSQCKISNSRLETYANIIQNHRIKNGKGIKMKGKIGSNQKKHKQQQVGQDMRKSRLNRLDDMLKDIKRCNQESINAIYSIKRSRMNTQMTPKTEIIFSQQQIMINELKDLRKEINDLKKNRKQNQLPEDSQRLNKSGSSSKKNAYTIIDKVNLNEVNMMQNKDIPELDLVTLRKTQSFMEKCPTCGCSCKWKKRI